VSLKKLGREELNAKAAELGVDSPEQLANKKAVIEAIESAAAGAGAAGGSVVEAVQADLADLAKRDPDLARSSRAASALVLARELDSPRNSATSKSMCSKALSEAMDRLLELAPPEEEKGRLDEISAEREKRRSGT
jgi:hypothetical protein